jgi:hypothetical protein
MTSSGGHAIVALVDEDALERARERLAEGAAGRAQAGDVREGIRLEARPVSRQLAEVRGLANQTIRRLERIETELLAERGSRVDDLGLLVDLIDSGWRTVDERLRRIEEGLQASPGATVYRIGEAG